ncbi:MAG: hypothetical protein GXO90_01620 [FCB group bacterium]|nr:hypothetical protein [FCB group bacterium]
MDTPLFRHYLNALCSHQYTRSDVEAVVQVFVDTARQIIARRGYEQFLPVQNPTEDDRDALALDLIAPLFARDKDSQFFILKQYFTQERRSGSDHDLQSALKGLLNRHIHQEAVRKFGVRDPLGRSIYESLHYLLLKHPQWNKQRNRRGEILVGNGIPEAVVVDEVDLWATFRSGIAAGNRTLTQTMEQVLEELIDHRSQRICLRDLVAVLRNLFQSGNTTRPHTNSAGLLEQQAEAVIQSTVDEINRLFLDRYELTGKLTTSERQAFYDAIQNLLRDLIYDGQAGSYFRYLSATMTRKLDRTDYQQNYRTRFEYVAKQSRNYFSAHLKNDIILE